MWLLFHHNAKTKVVEGGRSFVEACPECRRTARFDEVEVSDNYGVFFLDLLSDKERKYRCSSCREIFDLRDPPRAAAALESLDDDELDDAEARRETAHAADARRARELAALEARREAERAHRREVAAAREIRIEDELAELKKRMGR